LRSEKKGHVRDAKNRERKGGTRRETNRLLGQQTTRADRIEPLKKAGKKDKQKRGKMGGSKFATGQKG